MIEQIEFRAEKERRYADIYRNSITDGETIAIIIDNGEEERYFYKYLPSEGNDISIDLTPYCRAMGAYSMKDALNDGSEISRYLGRGGCIIHVEYNDGSETVKSIFPYGTWKETAGFLTKLPYLQVSELGDNTDPIIFSAFTWDDGNMSVMCGKAEKQIYLNDDNDSFLFQFKEYADKIEVRDQMYEDEIIRSSIPVRKVPRGMNTRRLIWRNEMGGYDAWAFEFLRESNFATTSDVFYSSTNGYTRTNRKSERLHTVETRELDDITAEVVAYVIASPEVYLWDYESNTAIPVDVVTEECRTYSDTELSGVQVSYRKRMRE